MLWAHPIFLIGAGVVGIIVVAAAAYIQYQQRSNFYEYTEPRTPQFENRILGPCSICGGSVSVDNGYQAPCHHYLHYTCGANAVSSTNSGSSIERSQICMACVLLKETMGMIKREQPETRLRNRATNFKECANCQKPIKDGEITEKLRCGHKVHKECWERMQNSASATCPACIEE